jgi:hypothetical protein
MQTRLGNEAATELRHIGQTRLKPVAAKQGSSLQKQPQSKRYGVSD